MQRRPLTLSFAKKSLLTLLALTIQVLGHSSFAQSSPPKIDEQLKIVLDVDNAKWTLRDGFKQGNHALNQLRAYVGRDATWDEQLVSALQSKEVSIVAIAASDQTLFDLYWTLLTNRSESKVQKIRAELFATVFEDCGLDARVDSALRFLRQKDPSSLTAEAVEVILAALDQLEERIQERAKPQRPLTNAEKSILNQSRDLIARFEARLKI
jgi:hypothetical protein